jgi:hypothetical protein
MLLTTVLRIHNFVAVVIYKLLNFTAMKKILNNRLDWSQVGTWLLIMIYPAVVLLLVFQLIL